MQLELVGCTGAGKSTLAKRIAAAAHARGVDLVLGDEVALNRIGLRRLRAGRLRAVAVHVAAFWGCVTKGWQHIQFIRFARRVLRHSNIPRRQQWNQLRKVLKQLGRYEVIQCRQRSQTPVLVDEGTLHTAHNLFVHVAGNLNDDHVRQFAERVPLPDVVIYLREHEDVLVERTLDRGHPRISDPTSQSVTEFVRQAVLAFEQLAQHERIASRMFVIQDGRIASKPMHLSTPEMTGVLEILRSAIDTDTLRINEHDCESTPAGGSRAISGTV